MHPLVPWLTDCYSGHAIVKLGRKLSLSEAVHISWNFTVKNSKIRSTNSAYILYMANAWLKMLTFCYMEKSRFCEYINLVQSHSQLIRQISCQTFKAKRPRRVTVILKLQRCRNSHEPSRLYVFLPLCWRSRKVISFVIADCWYVLVLFYFSERYLVCMFLVCIVFYCIVFIFHCCLVWCKKYWLIKRVQIH